MVDGVGAVLRHDFGSSGLMAAVLARGAELCVLGDGGGAAYLWDGGAAWARHAPVLFPIVGRLAGDALVHGGRRYPMNQHGFARDMAFEWVSREADGCVLALRDDAATQARYPFGFRFEVAYRAVGAVLEVVFRVINTGDAVLPCSFGWHPAFRWPLQAGMAKEAYRLTFDREETGCLRGVVGGLLTAADRANPVFDRRLALSEGLFAEDALIFPEVASRSVRFAAEGEPGLTVSWEGFGQLGVWSRAGGDFLCIEPWCGMASPVGFTGEFEEKPWLAMVPAGGVREARVRVAVGS